MMLLLVSLVSLVVIIEKNFSTFLFKNFIFVIFKIFTKYFFLLFNIMPFSRSIFLSFHKLKCWIFTLSRFITVHYKYKSLMFFQKKIKKFFELATPYCN
jgi:hypothetical protein